MDKDKNYEIELRAVPHYWFGENKVDDYYVQYRIKPEQLNWFKRKFMNHWHYIYHCVWDTLFELKIEEGERLSYYKKFMHTVDDIIKYENGQYQEALERRNSENKKNKERNKIFY